MNNLLPEKPQLLVLSLLSPAIRSVFATLQTEWEKYFYVEQIFADPLTINDYLNRAVGVLFIDDAARFTPDHYAAFQRREPNFLCVAIRRTRHESDALLYARFADQILYLDAPPAVLMWNSLAIIRRYWNLYAKATKLTYRGIQMDLFHRAAFLNEKALFLTPKEFALLELLIKQPGEYITKAAILRKIWKYEIDTTRIVDQFVFKLRRKLGPGFIEVARAHGVRIS